ncbi:MAG: hypothetical protein JSU74_10860 [Candidatus Zixiibacteriota bacterium]|nr:MAG: hypothetical protein JSU74_10860 [candidate division Zixibacteria bacterium]
MKTRVITSVLTVLLLLFAVVIVTAEEINKEAADTTLTATKAASKDSTSAGEPEIREPEFIAYYFHGTRRCVTCRKLESYTQEAIEAGFAEQLKSGVLVWRPVNTDEPDEEHFRKDYQLYTKSVILSQRKGDEEVKWKNLDKIWQFVRGDKEAYMKYIQDEVTAFLGES